jgi:hypothetical protein
MHLTVADVNKLFEKHALTFGGSMSIRAGTPPFWDHTVKSYELTAALGGHIDRFALVMICLWYLAPKKRGESIQAGAAGGALRLLAWARAGSVTGD